MATIESRFSMADSWTQHARTTKKALLLMLPQMERLLAIDLRLTVCVRMISHGKGMYERRGSERQREEGREGERREDANSTIALSLVLFMFFTAVTIT